VPIISIHWLNPSARGWHNAGPEGLQKLIHRSARKAYSPKSKFEILHIRRPTVPKTPHKPSLGPMVDPHKSWSRIKMRWLA
jgi:hypothetical protein